MNTTVAGLLCAACICLPAPSTAREPTGFASDWKAAVNRYEKILQEDGTVGSSMYFIHEGKVIGVRHYGSADLATGRAVDENTLYHWASITKTFTAVALMQLRDRGLVSLDDPIVRYLPEVREVHNPYGSTDEITLRHLITHSAGFRAPTFPWGGSETWHPHEPSHWWQVAGMMPYTQIEFASGSKFSYSNLGISMLGRVIEIVSGDDIEVYVDKNILMPLGMTRTYFDVTPYFLLKHRSNNYMIEDSRPVAQGLDFDTGATTGNGGLNGPVGDMIKWLNFWLGIGDNSNYETVLARKTLLEMWQPVFPTADDSPETRVGMGFFIIDRLSADRAKTVRYIGHVGGQQAFSSFVFVQPETRTAAVYANNTHNPASTREDEPLPLRRTYEDLMNNIFPSFER